MSVRISFEKFFGTEQADALVAAAEGHENGINSERKGSDPFKWAVLIAIGYQCVEIEGYRDHHGITVPWPEFQAWVKDEADLASHDGDCDYLALACGTYNEYMPQDAEAPPSEDD